MNVNLEIFIAGRWQLAGAFSTDEKSIKRGIACGGTFEYDIDYTVEQLENRPNHRVGLNYPVSFELFRTPRWEGDLEPAIGRPSWGLIAQSFDSVFTPGELRSVLLRDAAAVARLPETMKVCGVEDQVIERVAHRCAEIAGDLLQMKG